MIGARALPAAAPGWIGWSLRFGFAFLVLNALLTVESSGVGPGVRFSPRLSFEWCLSVGAMAAWITWRGPFRRAQLEWLAAGFVLLVLARWLDVTVPALYGRPLNLYWDGRHAWAVAELALQQVALWQVAAGAAATLLGVVALHRTVAVLLGLLARCLVWHRPRPALWVAIAALTTSFAAHPHVERDTRWFFSLPLMPGLAHQFALLPALWNADGRGVLPESPDFRRDLAGLGGADVLLVFAESYGAVAFDDPVLATALAPYRDRLAASIAGGGRSVVSARVRSPTFGGGSWLAHAALLSGLDTTDPWTYERLLASRRPTLVGHFARHGYRTVGWMPGLQRPWPEGAFYGYERLAGLADLGYAGAAFGYWQVPDQAALALLKAQEWPETAIAGDTSAPRRPRFVVFPTLASHAPFRPLPPYLADWSRTVAPDGWSPAAVAAAEAAPVGWATAREAYRDALRYQHDWLAGWFAGQAPRRSITIVVGDHQPLAAVSGAQASWDVPVHVVADDPALLARLVAAGFEPGLLPPAATLAPMHGLTGLLLDTFDGGS